MKFNIPQPEEDPITEMFQIGKYWKTQEKIKKSLELL